MKGSLHSQNGQEDQLQRPVTLSMYIRGHAITSDRFEKIFFFSFEMVDQEVKSSDSISFILELCCKCYRSDSIRLPYQLLWKSDFEKKNITFLPVCLCFSD